MSRIFQILLWIVRREIDGDLPVCVASGDRYGQRRRISYTRRLRSAGRKTLLTSPKCSENLSIYF
jgi:hypothetical protein